MHSFLCQSANQFFFFCVSQGGRTDKDPEQKTETELTEEEVLLKEMEEVKDLMEKKSKRSKAVQRKRKQKEKIRNVLRGQNILESDEAAEEDQELFRLQDIESRSVLNTFEDGDDEEDSDGEKVGAC